MKLFVTYCLVLLFGCVHFSNDQVSGKTDHELEKQTTSEEVQQQTPPALSFAADIRPNIGNPLSALPLQRRQDVRPITLRYGIYSFSSQRRIVYTYKGRD